MTVMRGVMFGLFFSALGFWLPVGLVHAQAGAAGFISEDLETLGILNAYGRSPLINYDKDGLPESNRDYALIGLQHLAIQKLWTQGDDHESRLQALEKRTA